MTNIFSAQIDTLMSDASASLYDLLVAEHTPALLCSLGFTDLPLMMASNHVISCLAPKNDELHHHGLRKEHLVSIEKLLANPAFIYDCSNRDDSIAVVTNYVDDEGLPLVIFVCASGVQCHGDGSVSIVNYVTSMYGKSLCSVWHAYFNALNSRTLLYVNFAKTYGLLKYCRCPEYRTQYLENRTGTKTYAQSFNASLAGETINERVRRYEHKCRYRARTY